MKKSVLLFVVTFLAISALFAQQKQAEYSRALKDVNVVVLSLSGNSTLVLSGGSVLKINSYLTPRGGVLGLQYPSERPEFTITDRQSGDTIFVSSPPKFSPNTIGISNYSENMDNIILLPDDKKIIISEAGNLQVEGRCQWLDVNNAGSVTVSLEEFFLKELYCNAQTSLKINDEALSKTFMLKSGGSDMLYINAVQINISLRKSTL